MHFLIIEDDDIKYSIVEQTIKSIDSKAILERACSYQSGVESICGTHYDLVILDMTLPVFDARHSLVGMDILTFGGESILRETRRKNVAAKFIVLSQYDTFVRGDMEVSFAALRTELMDTYGTLVLGCVRLDSNSISWKNELQNLISGGAVEGTNS